MCKLSIIPIRWLAGFLAIFAPALALAAAPPSLPGLQLLSDATGQDARHYATYRTDANGAAPKVTTPAGWEVFSAVAYSSAIARYVVTLRELVPNSPAPPTTKPTPTTLPALTVQIASANPAGYGLNLYNHTALQTYADLHYQGFEQNIVAQNCVGGLSLTNVRSTYAYRAKPGDLYNGQGLYLEKIPGPVTLTSCLFGWNGWHPGEPTAGRTMYSHNIYANAGASPPTLDHCILVGASNCGIQLRNGGKLTNCVIIDCGTGVEAVLGKVTLDHCTILGGHYYSDNAGNWTGNSALLAYSPVALNDVYVVPTAGQANLASPFTGKTTPQGAIVSGDKWSNGGDPPYVDTRVNGVTYTATNCVLVSGWPGGNGNGAAGWTIRPGPVAYDPTPILNAVLANKLSVALAADQLQSEIRGQVK